MHPRLILGGGEGTQPGLRFDGPRFNIGEHSLLQYARGLAKNEPRRRASGHFEGSLPEADNGHRI